MPKENVKVLTKDEVRACLAPLFADKALDLVVLFGSSAGGTLHKGSDIDVGFLFDRSADVVDLTNRVTGMLGSDNVDVVDLRTASPLLMYAAAQKGIALYEKEPGRLSGFTSFSTACTSTRRSCARPESAPSNDSSKQRDMNEPHRPRCHQEEACGPSRGISLRSKGFQV